MSLTCTYVQEEYADGFSRVGWDDPDKTILRVCDIHRERYTEMVEAGEVMTVENMEKGRAMPQRHRPLELKNQKDPH